MRFFRQNIKKPEFRWNPGGYKEGVKRYIPFSYGNMTLHRIRKRNMAYVGR